MHWTSKENVEKFIGNVETPIEHVENSLEMLEMHWTCRNKSIGSGKKCNRKVEYDLAAGRDGGARRWPKMGQQGAGDGAHVRGAARLRGRLRVERAGLQRPESSRRLQTRRV